MEILNSVVPKIEYTVSPTCQNADLILFDLDAFIRDSDGGRQFTSMDIYNHQRDLQKMLHQLKDYKGEGVHLLFFSERLSNAIAVRGNLDPLDRSVSPNPYIDEAVEQFQQNVDKLNNPNIVITATWLFEYKDKDGKLLPWEPSHVANFVITASAPENRFWKKSIIYT